MHWKLKAAIQNTVARLPSSASYAVYYWLQRHWGGLRQLNPLQHLTVGKAIGQHLLNHGATPVGKVFLEVGTGRVPLLPLAFWLMGAERTITLDLHPYLKEALVAESLADIARRQMQVMHLFGPLLDEQRFLSLLHCFYLEPFALDTFLDRCRIEYRTPADATATGLAAQSIDVHTSYTVLEHIPPPVLTAILEEGNRLVRPDGWFIHQIDYSDHFAHADPRISPINFLQYSEAAWARYAGNKYMYMNRLRHDDMRQIFAQAGHGIVEDAPQIDAELLAQLRRGTLGVQARFRSKTAEVLATTSAWLITQPSEDTRREGDPAWYHPGS